MARLRRKPNDIREPVGCLLYVGGVVAIASEYEHKVAVVSESLRGVEKGEDGIGTSKRPCIQYHSALPDAVRLTKLRDVHVLCSRVEVEVGPL